MNSEIITISSLYYHFISSQQFYQFYSSQERTSEECPRQGTADSHITHRLVSFWLDYLSICKLQAVIFMGSQTQHIFFNVVHYVWKFGIGYCDFSCLISVQKDWESSLNQKVCQLALLLACFVRWFLENTEYLCLFHAMLQRYY